MKKYLKNVYDAGTIASHYTILYSLYSASELMFLVAAGKRNRQIIIDSFFRRGYMQTAERVYFKTFNCSEHITHIC